MSVEQMRAYVIKVYDNPTWRNKVAKMRDGQIIAIYNSFREKEKNNSVRLGGSYE